MGLTAGDKIVKRIFKGDVEYTKAYVGETQVWQDAQVGQEAFIVPGTYQWTCPFGVYAVSVVCVGGGGGGAWYSTLLGGGAGGGALAWKNNIPVTPGQSYTVVVGAGGSASTVDSDTSTADNTDGGESYFKDITTVRAGGGHKAIAGYGTISLFTGDGGGQGARGGYVSSGIGIGGGGGAGGYSGNGGIGSSNSGNSAGIAPATDSGGGGGGSATRYAALAAHAGGGVGIYGRGPDGYRPIRYASGGGGSYGGTGMAGWADGSIDGFAGSFGGSAHSGADVDFLTDGSGGAVRIIWGDGRAFPETGTMDVIPTNYTYTQDFSSGQIGPYIVYGQFYSLDITSNAAGDKEFRVVSDAVTGVGHALKVSTPLHFNGTVTHSTVARFNTLHNTLDNTTLYFDYYLVDAVYDTDRQIYVQVDGVRKDLTIFGQWVSDSVDIVGNGVHSVEFIIISKTGNSYLTSMYLTNLSIKLS